MAKKKRNLLHKVQIFLEHLESNFHNPEKRKESVLQNTFPPKEAFSNIVDFCLERGIIKRLVKGKGVSREYEDQITLDGSEFLEKLRRTEREKQAHKFQRQLVITSLILAMGVSFNAISSTNVSFREISLSALLIGILALTLYVLVDFIKGR